MGNVFDSKGFYRDLGAIIRSRRDTLGVTQSELAAKVGVKRASIANIETGRQNVLVHQIFQIAAALDIDAADLLPQIRKPDHVLDAEVTPGSDLSPAQRLIVSRIYEAAVPTVPKKPAREKT